MIHATLQIKTSSHRALRSKTLALIKDSSGKPILFCSLTPRSKKRNEGAKSYIFKNRAFSLQGTPMPSMQFLSVGSHTFQKCGTKNHPNSLRGVALRSLQGIGAKKKKESFFSAQPWAPATQGELKQQIKSPNRVQQRYTQKWTQPGVKATVPSKWNGFAPFLALRSSKPQSQRRRRLLVSFLKQLAPRQSTTLSTGKQLYTPLLVNFNALNSSSKRLTHPALPLNHLRCTSSLYSDQNPEGSDLFKSLRGLRHKSLDLKAKLLGLKLGKACIFKGIQSIDVVMKQYTKPTCLLLQGLRMAGVRFNRLRVLRAADYNYDINSVSDREMKRLGLAQENSRASFPSLKRSNFGKLSTPNPHVPLPFGSDFVPLQEGNKSDCVSWLLDVSHKHELLQILVKSRLIKRSTRHTFWQARSFRYKIEKLLYRKNRRGAIRERVYCPLIQKKAVKKWKAFTDLSAALRAKKQVFVQRTPFYRLRRSFAPFLSKSSSITYHFPPKARKRVKKRVAWLRPKKFKTFEKYGSSLQKSRSFQKRPRFRVHQTRIIANVQNTLNNTIITITDRFGNTKVWCSSGSIGLKASRRSTNYAAQSVAEAVAKKCRKLGIRRVEVRVQGVGYGKPSALKGLRIGGLKIKRIVDKTPKPHNGCRAPKKRRV